MDAAITVASRKLSLIFIDNIPSIPKARLATPTSSWKGLPAGQPILVATKLDINTWPINAHMQPIPIIIKRNHTKNTSKTRLIVFGCLLKNRFKRAATIVINIKMYVISMGDASFNY